MFRMVQLLVRLLAPPGRVPDVLDALRTVMRPAQQARGCAFAQVFNWVNDGQRIEYVEEWEDAGDLQGEFGSERFTHLLELLEAAAERPVVEFRVVSETHGLEYVWAARHDVEPVH
jgi:quinol monooxygenase YgiN